MQPIKTKPRIPSSLSLSRTSVYEMMVTNHFLKYVLLCSLLICATRGDAMGYCATGGIDHESGCVDEYESVEQKLCLTLYVHHNDLTDHNVGIIAINDWEVYDGAPDQNAKLVARIQGFRFHPGSDEQQWYSSQNIVFEDDRWNGSSLEVRGAAKMPSRIQWAIVGGTGDFTFAQGIVIGKIISVNPFIVKIYIHANYRSMKTPILAYI